MEFRKSLYLRSEKIILISMSGKLKSAILSALSLIITFALQAQVLEVTAPFNAATAFLEPDGRNEIVQVGANEFVVLSKVKGGLAGESEFLISKYDGKLKNYYSVPFKVSEREDVNKLIFNGTHLILFIVAQDYNTSESKLNAVAFDPATGNKVWDKNLMTQKVGTFQVARSKGEVEESFENAICSGLSKHFIVPFEYQYQVVFSPDSSKILTYIFDYSKNGLIANAAIFNKDLERTVDGIVPIDNNFVNYGIHVNNSGGLYILNVDRLGRIVVIQYNLESRDNKLLDIQYASTFREGLKFHIHKDNEVYVGCVSSKNNAMVGVLYAKFNFDSNLVEKINFHNLSNNLLQTADATRSGKFKYSENWQNYELTNFYVNSFEKIMMILEKREVSSIGYNYKSESVLSPEKWEERMGKVNTESLVILSFNASDEVMWENYYAKSQSAELTSGMTSCSFVPLINDEAIKIIYASADNASGVFNSYNYVEWDAQSGSKIKEIKLQNDEGLALVRNYSIWLNNKFIVTGKKGLLGKKYIITTYKLSDNG